MILPEGLSLQRLSQPEEAESCARLMSSTEPWITLGRSREASLDLVRDAGREVYIARVGGLFAGFLILNMRGAFVGYIQTVCLVPEQRGQGLGTAIIGWAEDRIFRESPNVFMCVSSFNKDAQRLYQRLGYTVIGELTDYLVPGHSEILLRKSKGPWSRWAPRPV
jgi:ribosomal protein S18 acetylase RimI-like enzyme